MAYRKKRDKQRQSSGYGFIYRGADKVEFRHNKSVLPIYVSDANVKRAYRITDTLIKALGELEGGIYVENWVGRDVARVSVMRTGFDFAIKETTQKGKTSQGQGKSGKSPLLLTLDINCHSGPSKHLEYKDKPDLPLEDQVGSMILDMFIVANKLCAEEELSSRRLERKWAEEKRLRLLEEMKKEELSRVKFLCTVVADWQQADQIRRLIAQMEVVLPSVVGEKKREQIMEWVSWAKGKADWMDPLTAKEDDLLGKKNHLFDMITDEEDSEDE